MLSEQVGETIHSELADGTYRDPPYIRPVVLYLLGDAARDVNEQVFRAQRNDGPGDVASIVDRRPDELGPTLTPRPVPWPERPR